MLLCDLTAVERVDLDERTLTIDPLAHPQRRAGAAERITYFVTFHGTHHDGSLDQSFVQLCRMI